MIPVWQLGVEENAQMVRLMLTDEEGFSTKAEVFNVEKGQIRLEMKPHSAVVLKKIIR